MTPNQLAAAKALLEGALTTSGVMRVGGLTSGQALHALGSLYTKRLVERREVLKPARTGYGARLDEATREWEWWLTPKGEGQVAEAAAG